MATPDPLRLTSTSYVVLGMLEWLGPSTSYRLKRILAEGIEDFFPVPHTSFYAEPARLATGGLLDEEQEAGGRRRRLYSINQRGRDALAAWRAEPSVEPGQFRFPGMLKVFFGADPTAFAAEQAAHHRGLAEQFESVRDAADAGTIAMTPNRRLVLETGIRLHRFWTETWEDIGRTAATWPPRPAAA